MKLSLYLSLLFLFCTGGAWAQDARLSISDNAGSRYSVSQRSNDRNDYLHISKTDINGNPFWEADYDTYINLKPISLAQTSRGIVILAANDANGGRSFSLINYSAQNFVIWDSPGDTPETVPVFVMTDEAGNIYVCGNTKAAGHYKAGLWKFNSAGTMLWHSEYEALGNAYAHQLQILFDGNISLGVTVFVGSSNYGQYERRAITYDIYGRQFN